MVNLYLSKREKRCVKASDEHLINGMECIRYVRIWKCKIRWPLSIQANVFKLFRVKTSSGENWELGIKKKFIISSSLSSKLVRIKSGLGMEQDSVMEMDQVQQHAIDPMATLSSLVPFSLPKRLRTEEELAIILKGRRTTSKFSYIRGKTKS